MPILEKANTAEWGNCCAISPLELTSKVSFPMGNQPLYSVGLVKKAVEDGCKNIVGVIIEGAEAFEPLMENAAKAEGTKIEKFVNLPANRAGLQRPGGGSDVRRHRLPGDDRLRNAVHRLDARVRPVRL